MILEGKRTGFGVAPQFICPRGVLQGRLTRAQIVYPTRITQWDKLPIGDLMTRLTTLRQKKTHSKQVITLVKPGLTRLLLLVTGDISSLVSGMSYQVTSSKTAFLVNNATAQNHSSSCPVLSSLLCHLSVSQEERLDGGDPALRFSERSNRMSH